MAAGRHTIQKQIILEVVRQMCDHPTAEDVYNRVRDRLPSVSLATVYRNLEQMAAAGDIAKIESAGSARRYDGTTEAHTHVQCTCCGRIEDLHGCGELLPLERFPGRIETEFEIDRVVILFQGKCPDCVDL